MIKQFCWGLLTSITRRYFSIVDAGRVHTAIHLTSSLAAVLTHHRASFSHRLPKLFHKDLQNLGFAQCANTATLQWNNILHQTKWLIRGELLG